MPPQARLWGSELQRPRQCTRTSLRKPAPLGSSVLPTSRGPKHHVLSEQALDPPAGAWTQRCPPSRRASSDSGHNASERKDPRGPSCGPRGLLPALEVTLSILMCTGPFVQTMSPETPPQPPADSARVVDRLRAESPPLTQTALLPLPRQEMEHLGSAVIFLNCRFLP